MRKISLAFGMMATAAEAVKLDTHVDHIHAYVSFVGLNAQLLTWGRCETSKLYIARF